MQSTTQPQQKMKTKNTTTLQVGNSISASPFRRGFLLIPLALGCFGLAAAPKAFGVSPAPDGGYAGANTAEGQNSLQSLTSGIHNTALGYQTLFSNTTGHDNMATGFQALFSNTTGIYNAGNGAQALYKNTIGNYNTANGFRALYSNTNGSENTANGYEALAFNTTGEDNTANGFKALYSTTGDDNTANGALALYSNTTGIANTASGDQTLSTNTTGSGNTASGFDALLYNTTGGENTASGESALGHNTTGGNNIALGDFAGFNLTTGNNNIDIGNEGVAGESGKIRIGIEGTQTATFIAGIASATVTGSAVYINTTTGRLGLLSSSERFKDGIEPMGKASEALLSLRPVTFRYKKTIDPKGAPQFGLVAEEVEKVNPDLVVRDAEGKVFTVRYEAVNAMLLNEFLKEHRTVEEQEASITQLKSTVAQQQKGMEVLAATLKAQASQIQKVSAQLELTKPATKTVVNTN